MVLKPFCLACLILLFSLPCMAGQKSGVLHTTCEGPPIPFDFSEMTDTCKVYKCISDTDVKITTSYGLSAPNGIIDLGISDTNYLQRLIVVPDTGYKPSAQYLHLHLYAVKTSEGNYALLLEGTPIIGGCLHWWFFWAYNDDGSREFGVPAEVNRQKVYTPATSGRVDDGINGAVDMRGRLTTGHSKTSGIKLYNDKTGRVVKKLNEIP